MTHIHQYSFLIRVIFLGGVFLASLLVAQPVHAILGEPTPGGIRLAQNAALFTVTFKLGSNKGDFLVPFGAIRSTSDELDNENTHYYIEDKTGDIVEDGTTSGLLLSGDAPFSDGHYRVPEGETATFTLLVLFITDEEDPEFRLRMHTLPFAIDGYIGNQQYNQHELKYHTSGHTALNED